MGSSFKIKFKAISFCFQKFFVLSVISTIYRMGQRNLLIYKISSKKVVRIFIYSFEDYKLRSLNFLFSWFYLSARWCPLFSTLSIHCVSRTQKFPCTSSRISTGSLATASQMMFFKVLGRSMNTIDLR